MFQLAVHTLEVIEESPKIFQTSRGPASRPYASLWCCLPPQPNNHLQGIKLRFGDMVSASSPKTSDGDNQSPRANNLRAEDALNGEVHCSH